jgi:pimeloyl-ACP methyl ester carboxylesterase
MDALHQIMVRRADFVSQGTRCAGDLVLPKGVQRPPVVLMAHGFGAERSFRLPAFAERFVARGLAVFLFDYRCFGDSDGKPRNYVHPGRHVQDWQAAVAHVRSLPEVDTGRLGLWGTSLSGGHAIMTAADDDEIRALVIQVPFVDSVTTLAKLGLPFVVRALMPALRDLLAAMTRQAPYNIKIVGVPDEFAAMNTPEAWPGYLSLVPNGTSWQNRCPARALFALLSYRPVAMAGQVQCPALIMYGEQDSLISAASVEKTAARIPDDTLIKYPFGHFEIYNGEAFEMAVETQAQFLAMHLDTEG